MCDTLLAQPDSTWHGITLFGKNSDRQRNEAQIVERVPGRLHAKDALLQCTYLAIPQVRRTYAAFLCRPFWMWGAEMGVNECGVAIGNEALHARTPGPQEKSLLGMDLVRLGLERAGTAAEAVEVITTLLQAHGQGGNCGHLTPYFYNNGFMIADAAHAFVLETIGKEWLVEEVRGVRAISNRYSIHRPDRQSDGLKSQVCDAGWSDADQPDYAEALTNPEREPIGNAGARLASSSALLSAAKGRLQTEDLMRILRDHGSGGEHRTEWSNSCAVTRTLCMHAGAEDRPGQTVGSMVCELHGPRQLHWVTATAATCTSIFKPLLPDVPVPAHGSAVSGRFDPATLWWRHEKLHRGAVLRGLAGFIRDIGAERDALELQFRVRMNAVIDGGNAADRARAVEQCWQEAMQLEEAWSAQFHSPAATIASTPYELHWREMSRLAAMDDLGSP